jgi:hypothetical protein
MNSEKIKFIKDELNQYGIYTDADLIKQLGIEDESKRKLFLWISYQCAFSEKEGYERGQDDLKQQLTNFLNR